MYGKFKWGNELPKEKHIGGGGGLSARIRVHLYPVQSKHNYRVRGMKSRVFLDVPETGVRITVFTFDLNLISLFSLEILVIIKHYAE